MSKIFYMNIFLFSIFFASVILCSDKQRRQVPIGSDVPVAQMRVFLRPTNEGSQSAASAVVKPRSSKRNGKRPGKVDPIAANTGIANRVAELAPAKSVREDKVTQPVGSGFLPTTAEHYFDSSGGSTNFAFWDDCDRSNPVVTTDGSEKNVDLSDWDDCGTHNPEGRNVSASHTMLVSTTIAKAVGAE